MNIDVFWCLFIQFPFCAQDLGAGYVSMWHKFKPTNNCGDKIIVAVPNSNKDGSLVTGQKIPIAGNLGRVHHTRQR